MEVFGIPGEVVGIILGWALGVLSPILAWQVIRQRERAELHEALKAELTELRVTFAMEAHGLQERVAVLDDEFLTWELTTIQQTPGVEPKVQGYADGIQAMLEQPVAARTRPSGSVLLRKAHRLMLLEANISRLGMFPLPFQQRVLNILSQLSFWNDDVRVLESQIDKTFNSSMSTINHQIVQANVERNYQKALRSARAIADDIGVVIRS